MRPSWTAPLIDLIESLTCRVRVMSLDQVRRAWGDEAAVGPSIDRALRQLIDAGLVVGAVRSVAIARIGPTPVFAWRPGDSSPDSELIAAIVASRWPEAATSTPLLAATPKACRLFGAAGGGLPPASHLGHDLILAEVFTRYRSSKPSIAAAWIGENATSMAERGVKNPDAFVVDESGERVAVIESGGRYSAKQIQSFHDHCQSAALPYELW